MVCPGWSDGEGSLVETITDMIFVISGENVQGLKVKCHPPQGGFVHSFRPCRLLCLHTWALARWPGWDEPAGRSSQAVEASQPPCGRSGWPEHQPALQSLYQCVQGCPALAGGSLPSRLVEEPVYKD